MNEDVVAVFIPIVAIVMSLAIPIVYAILDYRRRRDIVEAHPQGTHGRHRARHGTAAAAGSVLQSAGLATSGRATC